MKATKLLKEKFFIYGRYFSEQNILKDEPDWSALKITTFNQPSCITTDTIIQRKSNPACMRERVLEWEYLKDKMST